MNQNTPWSLDAQYVLKNLEVNSREGLSSSEAEKRISEFGPNTISSRVRTSRLSIFIKQVINPMVLILVVAAAISFFLKEKIEGWAILSIVIINCLIGYLQESKAETAIEALADLSSPKGRVLRGGHVESIPSESVVPGDILVLEAGDYVVADARVIDSSQLTVDESILTGESLPVEKIIQEISEDSVLGERKNMLFGSTAVSHGSGHAVVVFTGKNTEIGKIARMMESTEKGQTPLQKRLSVLGHQLIFAGIIIIALVVGIGFFKGAPWEELIMSGLSLSVAAIPEGLPTIVTLALVMAVRRMARKKALVRKMDSVETLGATDIICSDKTGTLTTGKMRVRETHIAGDKERFNQILALCNNASLHGEGSGDTTEIAMLLHLRDEGNDPEEIRRKYQRLFEWSFESDRKRMSVAIRDGDESFVLTKGAPESVLSQCVNSEFEKKEITNRVSEFSKKGMRVLATAFKNIDGVDYHKVSMEEAESKLNFLGLVAIADPPKKESITSIEKCQKAGIRIIMITGDHPETAGAIAAELGIITEGERVLTGKEMDQLSLETLKKEAEKVNVYARVSPENKLTLVNALKSNGHIVAMTGDGVNDAPALKTASIGVAMGQAGTEVARQASSMILTDDNFATIVDAVEEGRAVHGNIKRTLQYLLSTNLAELLFIFASVLLGNPVPLLPVNLLWLNLVSDGLPSLALASEKVPEEYLEHSKRSSPDTFFDRSFLVEMFFIGIIITIMSLGVYSYGLSQETTEIARSYAFNFLVYAIMFRSLSCRSDYWTLFQMKPNYYLLASVVFPVSMQIIVQRVPLFQKVFRIAELDLETNLILLGLGLIPLSMVEIYKLLKQKLIIS